MENNPTAISHCWILDKIYENSLLMPNKIAVITHNDQCTYVQLQHKVNKLCEELHLNGVKPGQRVGLKMERSLSYPVAILALIRIGVTFVPLPIDSPQKRLEWMIKDAKLNYILSEKDFKTITQNIKVQQSAKLAYIMYTSGTTGHPKGVMVEYSSLNFCIKSVLESIGITKQDVCLHVAPFSFSASMRQLFLPLVEGATLALASESERQDPRKMWQFILNYKITVFNFSPFYFKVCLATLRSMPVKDQNHILKNNSIRLLVSASEPFPTDLALKWQNEYDQSSNIINLYGQTETTGVILIYKLSPLEKDFPKSRILPLGYPIPGVLVLIKDINGHMHSRSAEGEIVILGPAVSTGYLNDKLNIEASPFTSLEWNGTPMKAYCTGDFAKIDETGCIYFINRKDQRVKIRGQLLDTHEIEYVMKKILPIQDAVVLVDGIDNPIIIAHIIPEKGAQFEDSSLKHSLNEFLPAHMIPNFFICHESFPESTNTKLDYKAMHNIFKRIVSF